MEYPRHGTPGAWRHGGDAEYCPSALGILSTLLTVSKSDKERSILKGNVLKLNTENIFLG